VDGIYQQGQTRVSSSVIVNLPLMTLLSSSTYVSRPTTCCSRTSLLLLHLSNDLDEQWQRMWSQRTNRGVHSSCAR
jgi:hypothetical protein